MQVRSGSPGWKHVFANFPSPKSRIALQVARKIAPCDKAFSINIFIPGKLAGRS